MRKSIFTLLLMAFIVPVAMAYVPPKQVHPEVAYTKFKMYHTMLPQVGSLDVSNPDNANRTRWSIGCETLDRDYATFANISPTQIVPSDEIEKIREQIQNIE